MFFFLRVVELYKLTAEERAPMLIEIKERAASIVREMMHRYSTNDFQIVRKIGSGAFGVVSLVRCKRTGELFALKQIRKDGMLKKNHKERILAERTLLTELKTEWIVTLHQTFQDHQNLYMVMEYLPGGDMMSHLMRLDRFSEQQTQFYMAELVEAVHAVHLFGFIHRDIKPDNIVLTATGHLKLIDFGLCKFDRSVRLEALASDERMSRSGLGSLRRLSHCSRAQLRSSVGTPQYMAPEVLTKSYDHTSDFWSVGMIAYECLMGGTPFYDEAIETRPNKKADIRKILFKVAHYREYLKIPYPGRSTSGEAQSFLRNLLCEAPMRMRFDQIRAHPFFKGIVWSNLHRMQAPILPTTGLRAHEGGTVNTSVLPAYTPMGIMKDRNLDFVGYTYNRNLD